MSVFPSDTAVNAVLLSHILDILSLCAERHSYHIRNYIIDKNILARVLVLMTSAHGHLALGRLANVGGCAVPQRNADSLANTLEVLYKCMPTHLCTMFLTHAHAHTNTHACSHSCLEVLPQDHWAQGGGVQPVHCAEQPSGTGGSGFHGQGTEIQPPQLSHHRTVRVHQTGVCV